MADKFKTNRIFALQAASYDGLYGPRAKMTRFQKIVRGILIAPGVLLFLLPSFKLGLQHQRPPAFEVPDKVIKGSVFTVPVDPALEAITIGGQTLPQIKGPKPALLAVANSDSSLSLVLIYKGPERKISLDRILPKLEHPSFDVFSKQIVVEPAPVAPEPPKKKESAPLVVHELDPTLMARNDGAAQASCWTEPKTNVLPEKPNRDRRRLPVQYANLTSMAAGEVVKVESIKTSGSKNVVVYHGGGLFSRYLDLKETLVRKGDKIQTGQEVGMLSLGTWRTPLKPRWDIYLGSTELNPQNFLALSSQLCDSK